MISSKLLVLALVAVVYAADDAPPKDAEKGREERLLRPAPRPNVQPVRQGEIVPILRLETSVETDGKYHYSFETGDGTKAQQDGELKSFDKDDAGEVVHGEYSYVGDDGHEYKISYVANELGYQPQGEHLPVAPPIPPLIQRALEYLATAPPPKEETYRGGKELKA